MVYFTAFLIIMSLLSLPCSFSIWIVSDKPYKYITANLFYICLILVAILFTLIVKL